MVDALRADAAQLSGVADDERTILALHASDAPIGSFPGRRSLGRRARCARRRRLDRGTGQHDRVRDLRAAGRRNRRRARGPSPTAGRWLAAQQNADGGFSFARRGAASDSDDTAAALQGLADSLGRVSPAVGRAVRYLRATQNADGGWSLGAGAPSDAQSTAWAIQALDAAGIDPGAVRRAGGRSPVAYLLTLVGPDGSVHYSRTSDQTPVWVTSQALTALGGAPFPVPPPVARRAAAAPTLPAAVAGTARRRPLSCVHAGTRLLAMPGCSRERCSGSCSTECPRRRLPLQAWLVGADALPMARTRPSEGDEDGGGQVSFRRAS